MIKYEIEIILPKKVLIYGTSQKHNPPMLTLQKPMLILEICLSQLGLG